MSTGRKYTLSAIIALLCAVLAAALCLGGTTATVGAETADAARLSPIECDSSDIVYHCFDAPISAYADGLGILVAGKNSIEAVSGETDVTSKRNISADKVYRHLEHGDHSEYIVTLFDGTLTAYCGDGDGVALPSSENIVDFAVDNDTVYAIASSSIVSVPLGATSFDAESMSVTELSSDVHASISVSALAVINGRKYVAVDSSFGNKQDICVVTDDGKLSVLHMQSDKILSLASDPTSDTVYALTRDELVGYFATASKLVRSCAVRGTQFTSVYAYDKNVYALDTLNALHKLSADLKTDKTLLASAGFAQGFFNMPFGVSVKNSKLYIADSVNGRIAVYGDGIRYSDREFVNPVSVACDSAGTVYVAYEYDKVGIFRNGDFSKANEQVVSSDELGNVKQVAVDAEKTLYILSDTGVWRRGPSGDPTLLIQGQYKTITLSVGREALYALTDDSVLLIDAYGQAYKSCDAASDTVDIAVDLANSVFMLSQSGVTVYKSGAYTEHALSLNGESYALGGKAGQIVLCAVENEFVKHGDVVIADTYRHRIFKLDGINELGASFVDENYEVPDIVNDTTPEYYGTGLIRTALRDADVFSLPMETRAAFTITAGRKVIVPHYNLEETKEYSLVLIDDIENGKLIQGYVYKDALSEPLPYSDPPSAVGSIFNAATPVYKWPSRNAKTVRGYSAVDQNTEFGMLDFVESYRDDYGYLWYRIALDGGNEGFILAINMSTMSYEPVYIHPACDAEIISYKNSKAAAGYIIENGEYVKIAELPTGTQVEVIGAFDTSKRYTKVKFLDPDRGTLTCYVETVYIKYNGVNIVLIVALIVIAITVILAAIIIGKVMHNKRKRLERSDDDDER